MARTFPAVLIKGILESGKTKFIIDSLKNGDFGDIGKVLILATEDGIEEYDSKDLDKANAVAYTFESQEEFTVQKINELIKINKPHAIFIEMNAMWDWSKIEYPPYLLVEQSFTIIDGTTFEIYFNNMRQKITDMVKSSNVVIVNRCKNESKFVGYKRSLKLANKDAFVLMLDDEGNNISFVEELPYKLSNDMKIEDDDFGIFYIDTFENQDRYDGKIVEFNCLAVFDSELPPNAFIATRPAMTCCADDIELVGHICAYQGPVNIPNDSWIHLRARVHYLSEFPDQEPTIMLELLQVRQIAEIANPVVSLNG